MNTTLQILLAVIVFDALHAQDNVDPFAPAKGPNELTELDDIHRWSDQFVKQGDPRGPAYISIGGSYNKLLDRVSILFRVGLNQYNESIGHPDMNRGVVLISGRPKAPDLYTWLRPLLITKDHAEFVLTVSPKQLESMSLAFIPHEGKQRYLYSLRSAAQDMKEAQQAAPSNR